MSRTPETQPKAGRVQRGTRMTSGRSRASPWTAVSTSHRDPSAQDRLTPQKKAHHSIMAATAARERPVIRPLPSRAPPACKPLIPVRPAPVLYASTRMVTGPSATMSMCMWAPKRPVATSRPRCRSAWATASTRGSATGAGAAWFHDGRRPLRTSA